MRAFASPDVSVNEITSYEMIMQKMLIIFKPHRVERLQLTLKDMEQQGDFIQKKKNRMKRLIALWFVYLIGMLQLDAQNCIDTVHIKGYYVVKKIGSELTRVLNSNKNVTIVEQRMDIHRDASFIPCDSISKKYPLSFWLNHFFHDTKQVFVSCETINLKYLVTNCPAFDTGKKENKCLFPNLKANQLYRTTDMNTGDVFEIYYIDAYWAKVQINKESIEASMIPSRIAQTAISSDGKAFDLYYFVTYDDLQTSPNFKDANIKIWKK
jgi:hypothetical protein